MSKIYNGALELVGNTPLVEVKNIEEENETKKDERLNKIVRGKIISV